MTAAQKQTLEAYAETGRAVHYYPRKKMVSLNGFRPISLSAAVALMRKYLDGLAQ